MGILSWIVLGLLVGVLARWIMPGPNPAGLIRTTLLGVVGALLGGFVATGAGLGAVTGFNLASVAIATAGALVLLVGQRLVTGR